MAYNRERKRYFGVCRDCMRPTVTMMPLDNGYTPTAEDKAARPGFAQLPIARERLQCKCGQVHTWFSVFWLELV